MPQEVAPEVVQHLLAAAGVLCVHHPRFVPERVSQPQRKLRLLERIAHLLPKQHRQHSGRKQEVAIGCADETLCIRAESAGRDEQVRVRMIS